MDLLVRPLDFLVAGSDLLDFVAKHVSTTSSNPINYSVSQILQLQHL